MKKIPENTLVKYRYVIPMSDRIDTIKNIINKWTKKYVDKIYFGQLMLLVSPIYTYKDNIFVQPVIDVDAPFNEAFRYVKNFLSKDNRKKHWIAEFTGKTSFHLISNFAIILDKGITLPEIRKIVYEPLKLKNEYVDIISSIRDMPFVRIGYRQETKKLAFPVLDFSMNFIRKNINQLTFKNVFKNTNELAEYIRNWIFPRFYIKEDEYVRYI